MKKSSIVLLVALLLVLVGSILGYLVQTDFGKVEVRDIRFNGRDGKVISALLYVPQNATNETPAPAVMTMHGFMNSRETQSGFNIEFARRGYVVLALDMTGHGYTEQTNVWPNMLADPTFSYGASDGLRYLANLPFVDKENIGVEGHSMGGWAMINAALQNPGLIKSLILSGSGPLAEGLITAETGYNLGVIMGRYDEFSLLMWGKERGAEIVDSQNLLNAFGATETIEPEKLHGSFDNQTARIFYMPNETHPKNHLSRTAIGHAVDFMQQSIPTGSTLDPANQIWQWKEFGTMLVMLGVVLFVFAAGARLFDLPYFKAVTQPVPASSSITGWGWWLAAVIGTIVPVATYTQMTVPYSNNSMNSFWPQLLTNGLVRYVIITALIAIILFLAWHFLSARRRGANVVSYGLSTNSENPAFSLRYIGRSLLLAAIIVAAAHLILSIVQSAFLVDARWWVLALKPMDPSRFIMFLKYLIPFLLFFLINGLILHGQLRPREFSTGTKTAAGWMLAAAGINALGVILLIAAHLIYLFTSGKVYTADLSLFMILGYQVIFVLIVTACISAYFFKKTGNIYTGAFICAMLTTWYIVAGQAVLLPV